MEEGQGAVLLGIIEGQALLQMGSSRSERSEKVQRRPQRPVSLQKKGRVLPVLG
jgi:hypothetical protein